MARSTFASQTVQKTSFRDRCCHFSSGKMARGCGAKHILQSKCTKHHNPGPLFGLQMSKNRMPLWREARLQVKMWKNSNSRAHFGRFDPAKWYAAVARSTFAREHVKKLTGTGHFSSFRCPKMARRCGAKHICKSKCTKHLRFAAFLTD